MRWTWANLDREALESNVRFLLEKADPMQLMAVVKANAYGHGAVWTAWHALAAGASWLGVATPAEAAELRSAGISAPILVLGAVDRAEVAEMAELGVSVTVLSEAWIPVLAEAAAKAPRPLRVHLKVDTGMGRIGVAQERAFDAAEAIRGLKPALDLEGIFTHLARANDDAGFTELQISRFRKVLEGLPHRPKWAHALNSAAILSTSMPEANLARAGIAVYGVSPAGRDPLPEGLQPVLGVEARTVHVKTVPAGTGIGYGRTWIAEAPTVVAILPIGYADGIPRLLSNRGQVLFKGERYPIIGRISMDQMAVGLPQGVPVKVGDLFTLIGRNGDDAISADEMAGWAETIGYEIVTRLGSRLPRRDLFSGTSIT